MSALRKAMRSRLARDSTGTAHNALIRRIQKLRLYQLRFGIMTPRAIKRTSLKKHGGSYSGTVVYAKFLNVENSTFHFFTYKLSHLDNTKRADTVGLFSVSECYIKFISVILKAERIRIIALKSRYRIKAITVA